MKLKTTLTFILAAALVACQPKDSSSKDSNPTPPAPQNTTGTRGGGDVDVVAFLHFSNQIAQWLSLGKSPVSSADAKSFSEMSQTLAREMDRPQGPTIVFVQESLKDPSGAPKMAIFQKNPLTVFVERSAWQNLSAGDKYSLVALEIMGLISLSDRYSIADVIKQNLHEISGIPTAADEPYITRSGIIFSELEAWEKSRLFLRLTAGFINKEDGDDEYLFGNALYHAETERMKRYKDLSRGFLSLPELYKMDVLVSTATAYGKFEIDGLGYGWRESTGFRLPSEALTIPIKQYLDAVNEAIGEFLNEKKQMNVETIQEIQQIQTKIQELRLQFTTEKVGESFVHHSPYEEYFRVLLGKMRQEIKQRQCKVPSTYKVSPHHQNEIDDIISQPVETGGSDLRILRENSRKLTSQISTDLFNLADQWRKLAEKKKLDRIQFHFVYPLKEENMAEGVANFMDIARAYIRLYIEIRTDGWYNELGQMERMLRRLQAGELCAH
ncbi:MAG: hypothetical protein ACAH59_11870 [Pseudobdellovibrionaceae bacterium]